ncbi:MAG: ATP-binding cassette domain-containing protein [Deltaproteobacteria bacterium]|nr:ATP-binding cassette domain-containing protein [Deltaproteobacteria bacterium]
MTNSPIDAIVEASELRKTFGELQAVDGISFGVAPGECFGILGPNGAGKTTTIRMIYAAIPATAGTLRVFDLDISREWRAIKRRIGVCQQDNNLDPDLTVLQNLEVFARYFDIPPREARVRARELLAFIALEHRSSAQVTELSGGMMRRLVLARALINDPELLILDEPTTGLDPQSRHQVWERLEQLKSEGLTILLTTHYMDEAARLCDRVVIMDHGKILVDGPPADLVREYVGKDVIEVYGSDEELHDYVERHGWNHERLPDRFLIYSADGERIFKALGQSGRGRCTLRMATLEDVFLKLTGRDLRE